MSSRSAGCIFANLNADYVCAFGSKAMLSGEPPDSSSEAWTSDNIDFGDMPDFMK